MRLGTGIFLSAIILGLIALYIATRDQWDWKRIIIRTAIGIVTLILLVGIGFLGLSIISKRAEKPRLQKDFFGLTLDSTKEDIKFIKGAPSSEEENVLGYDDFFIIFKDNKIKLIAVSCSSLKSNPYISLENIHCGDSYKRVIERFGEPTYISRSKDDLSRIFSFEKYNVFFELEKGEVIYFGIYNPTFGHVKYKEEQNNHPNS